MNSSKFCLGLTVLSIIFVCVQSEHIDLDDSLPKQTHTKTIKVKSKSVAQRELDTLVQDRIIDLGCLMSSIDNLIDSKHEISEECCAKLFIGIHPACQKYGRKSKTTRKPRRTTLKPKGGSGKSPTKKPRGTGAPVTPTTTKPQGEPSTDPQPSNALTSSKEDPGPLISQLIVWYLIRPWPWAMRG